MKIKSVDKDAPDPLFIASDVARQLGHTPMRYRGSWECWTCKASGAVDDEATLTGTIFQEKCK